MVTWVLVFFILFGLEVLYLYVAKKYNIIDNPSERSSHTYLTRRGGGIIFPIAWLLYFFLHQCPLPFFTLGLIIVSTISFLDDMLTISAKYRIIIHVFAFSLCFYQLHLINVLPWWALAGTFIFCIGCLNAINFMDGINGMTGLYFLSIFLPLIYFRQTTIYSKQSPYIYIVMALLIFGFFNFRKRAICFAGDIGSVSIAFITIYFIIQLLIKTNGNFLQNIQYILLLALYGIDSVFTLLQRLYNRENIFHPHRKHLYQLLANELNMPQISVAAMYASIQFGINIWVFTHPNITLQTTVLILFILSVIYIVVKRFILVSLINKQMKIEK